jgi:hypothetical protein
VPADDLYGLLQAQGPRDALRTVLIEAFFAPEVRSTLTEQGAINHEGFRYSEQLLRRGTGRLPSRWQKRERIGRLHAIRGFAVPW